MDFKENIKKLSGRIIILDTDKEKFAGSGILYVADNTAYMFTAAHVLGGERYRIEFFHGSDETDRREDDYLYEVGKGDFRVHTSWSADADGKDFNPYDIAGIRLEKRDWMEHMSPWIILSPREDMSLSGYGYPFGNLDRDIQFAGDYFSSCVEAFSSKKHRLQFQYTKPADFSDLGKAMEGFSGTGVLCTEEDADGLYLLGLIQSGQGTNIRLGTLNVILADQIVDLCLENNWVVPKSEVEYVNKTEYGTKTKEPEVGVVSDESPLNVSTKELFFRFNKYISGKIQKIKSDIRSMQIQKALERCAEEKSEMNWQCYTDDQKCDLIYLEAHCYYLAGDLAKAESCLKEADIYSGGTKYWLYYERSTLELEKGELSEAERMVDKALEYAADGKDALLLKRYIEAIKLQADLADKLFWFQNILEDMHFTLTRNQAQSFYSLQASLCINENEKERAIEYYQQAYGIQGDKAYLISIAQNYYLLAMEQSPVHMIYMEKASIYYVAYVNACDEMLRGGFYREHGMAFMHCEYLLKNYDMLLLHMDQVLAATDNADRNHELQGMKADAQMSMGNMDSRVLERLEKGERLSLAQHHNNLKVMDSYIQTLNQLHPVMIDYENGYQNAKPVIMQLQKSLDTIKKKIDAQTYKIIETIDEINNDKEKGKLDGINAAEVKAAEIKATEINADRTTEDGTEVETEDVIEDLTEARMLQKKNNCRVLYLDLLGDLLTIQDADRYNTYLNVFKSLYPECREEYAQYELLADEANGHADLAEQKICRLVKENPNPQNYRTAIDFYMRNHQFSKVRSIYRALLDDQTGAGQLGRDTLIFQYCIDLFYSNSTRLLGLQTYINYRNEIQENKFNEILEMTFRPYTMDYSDYLKWLSISDKLIKTNLAAARNEYIDAIMLCIYNLDDTLAKMYYHNFMETFYPGKREDEFIPAEAAMQVKYFALVSPGRGGKQTRMVSDEFEREACKARNINRQGFQKTDGKTTREAVIDIWALYILTMHDRLNQMEGLFDSLIVTYSSVDYLLKTQYSYDDPVEERMMNWMKSGGIVTLQEPSLEKQVEYRNAYGEKNWWWKSTYGMAMEKDIPVIYALHWDMSFLSDQKVESHLIWIGDFLDFLEK